MNREESTNAVVQYADHALYETDEHAWIARQIELLRSGSLHELDRDSLVEYLTDMAKRDLRELESRFAVLLQHLLKVRLQPGRLAPNSVLTILRQQQEILRMLKSIPSMGQHTDELFDDAYERAVRLAAAETGRSASDFPARSPWSTDEALAFAPPEPKRRTSSRRPRGA